MNAKQYIIILIFLFSGLQSFAETSNASPALSSIMTWVLGISVSTLVILSVVIMVRTNQLMYKRILKKSKEKALMGLFLLFALPSFAEGTTQVDSSLGEITSWVFGIAVAILVLVSLIFMVRSNQVLSDRLMEMEAEASGVILPKANAEKNREDFWQKIKEKYWTNAVPIEQEETILLHHDFDGIRELDNSLPPWWINMFYMTIIWAFGYMYFYHWGGPGLDSHQEYLTEVAEVERVKLIALQASANKVDESNVTVLADASAIGEGETIFKGNCATCHGQLGEGLAGPNFTDAYWIHGGGIQNIFKTIKYGVQEKGMQEWASRLSPSDIQKVSSYILTLEGTNPPNAKEAQGEIWTPEAEDEKTTESKEG